MANTSLALFLDQKAALGVADPASRGGRELIRKLINHLEAFESGNKQCDNMKVWIDGVQPSRAKGLLTASGASGTVGATINGVGVTAAHVSTDAGDCTLIAAAINASTDALVQYMVRASNYAMTITLASVLAGTEIDICGYKFVAQSGGVLQPDGFDIAGTDTQDAASLVTQINLRPGLRDLVFASNSSGVVTLRQWSGTTAVGLVSTNKSTVSLSGAFAATAVVQVSSILPGIAGNCITFAASGTGMTASVARLAGGAGLSVVPVSFNLHSAV